MRYRVEFWSIQYPNVGVVTYPNNGRIEKVKTTFFGECLEKTDTRLYTKWADGITIFFLTERQYNKLIKLLLNNTL